MPSIPVVTNETLPPREEPAIPAAYAALATRLERAAPPLVADAVRLVDDAITLWTKPGLDTLISLPRLRFRPFPHQIDAARVALGRLRARAILADEVGLGKTIEACLVLSELYLRRLVRRPLILVPAGLVEQWREELDQKFVLPAVTLGDEGWDRAARPAEETAIVVGSLPTARRTPWREAIAAIDWDMIIVDEAHRLKNPQSVSASFVRSLRTSRLLLLTATPVENKLDDLFHLVNFVRPGQLGTPKEFRARHGGAAVGAVARDLDALQIRMRDVMIRHRRNEVALMLPRRLAETRRVAASPAEAELYAKVSARVREHGSSPDATPARLLALRSVQRLAGSSPRAAAPTLARLGWDDLGARARAIETTEKGRLLLQLLERHRANGEKAIVFTAFRETLAFLDELVKRAGFSAAIYHGGLTRHEKIGAIEAFRGERPFLLTTEAAGEGRNLQFCHVMINFDLPWNPMQIEQRLGRIHRIGQERDVVLTNLVGEGTIEERILHVLESKINLFELVVGELDMILGRIDDAFDIESFIFRSHVESRDDAEFRARVEALGDDLASAREAYLQSRAMTDRLSPALARG